MKKDFLKALGTRVQQIREKKGMAKTELAKATKKDYHSILRLEQGGVNPSLVYLMVIAKGLDTDVATLVKGL